MTAKKDTLIKDRMSDKLITLTKEDKLADALLITCSKDVRHIPIVDGKKLIGLISDRDIKRNLPTRSDEASVWDVMEQVKIEEIMIRQVLTISKESTLREAALVMMREKVNALPVVDEEMILLGIITTEDILWDFIVD